jgi:hypothetical protein
VPGRPSLHERLGDHEFVVPRDVPEDREHQANWRRCTKCFAMFWLDPHGNPASTGRCPGGGLHAVTLGVNLSPRHVWREEDKHNQRRWRFCVKCHGLFFDRYIGHGKGACPAGDGGHSALGLEFVLPFGLDETPTQQSQWRFCEKCFVLYYDGFPDKGKCAGKAPGEGHETVPTSYVFSIPHDLPVSDDRQGGWRYCNKCAALVFSPDIAAPCAAGGVHDLTLGFHFQLPCQPGLDPDRSFRFCLRCRCMVRHDHWIDRVTGHALDSAHDDWASWLATCVVTNQEHAPDLPGVPEQEQPAQGLVMLAYDGYRFRLAWMPLWPGRKPRFDTIRYYHRFKDRWTKEPDLSAGSELFVNMGREPWSWTHVSAMWIKEAQSWIVIYHKGTGDPNLPIVARIGQSLGCWSDELLLFDPKVAFGKFIHHAPIPDSFDGKIPPFLDKDGFAYGAFILERYTNWDASRGVLNLYYLMSTFAPYQVHVMHSEIRIPNPLVDLPLPFPGKLRQTARWFVRPLRRMLGWVRGPRTNQRKAGSASTWS